MSPPNCPYDPTAYVTLPVHFVGIPMNAQATFKSTKREMPWWFA